MRQVTRGNMNVAAGERHVRRQLSLDGEVALKRVGVFEVFLHVQRERKHWTKARERLIVESLTAELILSAGRHTRRLECGWKSICRDKSLAQWREAGLRTYRPLEDLNCIQQYRPTGCVEYGWTSRRQNSLLLLHGVSDVGVERDCQQRVIVEEAVRGAH